jgi:hypothetical protein
MKNQQLDKDLDSIGVTHSCHISKMVCGRDINLRLVRTPFKKDQLPLSAPRNNTRQHGFLTLLNSHISPFAVGRGTPCPL